MFDESCDRWQYLLGDIPVSVNSKTLLLVHKLLRAVGHVTNIQLLALLFRGISVANEIWNEIVDQISITLTLSFHPQSYLNVR